MNGRRLSMSIFPKVNAKKLALSSFRWYFLRALFYTSRVSVFNGSVGIRNTVTPGMCRVHVRKKCTGESESERVMSYTRGAVQVRSCRFGCIVVSGPHPLHRCTAAVPGTKTSCRTITLNKSLHPIAIRRGVLRWLFISVLLSKQDQNDRRHRPVRCREFIARGDALLDY